MSCSDFKKGHQCRSPRNDHQGNMPYWWLVPDPVFCWYTSLYQIIIWIAPPPCSAEEYLSCKWDILTLFGTRGQYWGETVLDITGHFNKERWSKFHYNDVIMSTMASQTTDISIVCWTVGSDIDQRKHQSSTSLAFVREFTGERWFPLTKGQLCGKCLHLMTSCWLNHQIENWLKS